MAVGSRRPQRRGPALPGFETHIEQQFGPLLPGPSAGRRVDQRLTEAVTVNLLLRAIWRVGPTMRSSAGR